MKKVLIIEDDQLVGNIYRHKFQAEGFQAQVASDGELGFQAVLDFKPDVVILDLMLPKLNGVEVLKRIRANPDHQSLPVLVLSNAYLSNLVQDAWNAGANQCLVKANCTPRQLIELVQKTLGESSISSTTATAPGAPAPASASTRPGQAAPAPGQRPTSDTALQAELRQTFLQTGNDTLAQLRGLLQTFIKSEGDTARLPALYALYRRVHSLTSNSAVAGLAAISRMAAALEAFVKELYEKPKNINASTVRSLAHAIDFLAVLFDQGATANAENTPPASILVVDDEVISRRAVVYALEKAHLPSVTVDNPEAAVKMASENRFDLIFLDVDMPGMSGYELCAKVRSFPLNSRTPVIFVTGLTDFESRARSTLSGGNDLIAKPFLFMELAVKALTHVLRAQLNLPAA